MNKKALSPIFSVLGALLLAIVVGVFSASPFGEPNVAHAQASDDARLSSLTTSGVAFMSPAFDAATLNYRARASSSTSTVSVSANARNSQSMVDIESGADTNDPGTGRKTQSITLAAAGSPTTITVVVTPPSGTEDNRTYTITLHRESATGTVEADLTAWDLNTDADGSSGTNLLTAISSPTLKASAANADHDASKLYFSATGSTNSHIRVEGLHYNGAILAVDAVPINLNNKGMKTTFTITVTSEDGGSSNTYTVTAYRYRQTQSNVNTLNSLSLGSGIRLMPPFASGTTKYTARVPYDIGDGTVTHTLTDTAGGAMAVASGVDTAASAIDDTDDTTSAYDFRLDAGMESTITVVVTPESGPGAPAETCPDTEPEHIKCYEVVVYRENLVKSDDKTLTALTVADVASPGDSLLGSDFDDEITEYTNNAVATTVSRVTVTPTLANTTGGANYVIDPPDAVRGGDHQVNLAAGQVTTITITVTAEDGTMETYTVVLYRMRAPSQISDDARLKSLRVTDSSDMDQVLDPTFDSGKTMYNVRVAHRVTQVTIVPETFEFGANFTYDPDEDINQSASGHQVNLAGAGEAPIEVSVMVTAEDGAAMKTYTVMLYRESSPLSNDASLEGLTLSPSGMMTPVFVPATTDYRVVVGNGVPSVSVSAVPMQDGADYDIEPDDEDSNNDGHQIIATVGTEKVITVTVTAEDGTTTKTYTVTLYRERAPRSDDATLSALSLDNASLLPAFSPDNI